MENPVFIILALAIFAVGFYLVVIRVKGSTEDQDALAKARNEMDYDQVAFDEYINRSLTPAELGERYERYLGHIYEKEGYDVEYHGAVQGVKDLGRDLIIKNGKEILVVQAKCWSSEKLIHAKHVFELVGSMAHYVLTSETKGQHVRAVFYVSYARYTGAAVEVAHDLGVDLKTEKLNNSYPMVKCKISGNGDKTYHLPFDAYYDELKVDPRKGEFFAYSVLEAFDRGYRRPRYKEDAA